MRGKVSWQRRFYDFNVWSQRRKIEKRHYMHMNPVKRGLVTDPKLWPWSSYRFYQFRGVGLCDPDFVQLGLRRP
jgi:REP-associated tyrosine transposase